MHRMQRQDSPSLEKFGVDNFSLYAAFACVNLTFEGELLPIIMNSSIEKLEDVVRY